MINTTFKKLLAAFAVLLVLFFAASPVYALDSAVDNATTASGTPEQTAASSESAAESAAGALPEAPSPTPEPPVSESTPESPVPESFLPEPSTGQSTPSESTPSTGAQGDASNSVSDTSSSSNTADASEKDAQSEPDSASEENLTDDAAIMPFGVEPIDATSARVDTYDSLQWALAYGTYTTIYLGADITPGNTSLTVGNTKASVVIDGTRPEGGYYTLHQSDWTGTAIAVGNTTTKNVTLRNLNVEGKHSNGAVYVSQTGVNVTYDNVHYTGPQAAYNRGGTTNILGGSYTLTGGELTESRHVVLGGDLTVTSTSTGNSVIWLTQTDSTLTFQEGAHITVNTKFYFLYTERAINVTLPSGSSFSLTSDTFGFSYDLQNVNDFILKPGSSLYINLNTTRSTAALRVARLFQMEPGSSATIIRTGTDGIPLRLTAANAEAVFDQPERVFFYSSAKVPLRFTGAGTLSINTSALNVWQNIAWPPAEGIQTQPTSMWNKAGDALFTFTGSYSTSTLQKLVSNLNDEDPVTTALDAKAFNMNNTMLLAFGRTSLSVDPPGDRIGAITGATAAGAGLLASYQLADGSAGSAEGAAGGDTYSLPVTNGPLLVNSIVSVINRAGNLYMRQNATVTQSEPEVPERLAFLSIPDSLSFESGPVPGSATLVPHQGDFTLSVEDTRQSPSPWYIEARLAGPMTATVNGQEVTLTDSLVFVGADGQPVSLEDGPAIIYRQDSPAGGVETLQWGPDEGFFLQTAPGEPYSDISYNATIHWTLVSAP